MRARTKKRTRALGCAGVVAGAAARGTIADLVYAVLTQNIKMPDNKALFHADHHNLLSAKTLP